MPVKHIHTSPAPGYFVQICAACSAEHTISFDRAGQKAKTGPVVLEVGDTLVIRVDLREPVSITFAAGDFPNLARVTAAELAARLNRAVPGIVARDDAGGLLIESATLGEASRLEIVGGTARGRLGFTTDERADPCVSRPVLGVSALDGKLHDKNIIAVRRCNDCGANECLVRTFDVAPDEAAGTFLGQHRKSVNALAEHCKACGWSDPHVAAFHAAETARPHDVHHGLVAALSTAMSPDLSAAPANAVQHVGGGHDS
jgi:hypothetical protein